VSNWIINYEVAAKIEEKRKQLNRRSWEYVFKEKNNDIIKIRSIIKTVRRK
jgi:hypothetical protein